MKKNIIKSTTIIGIRKEKSVVIAGDGQASLGNTIMKPNVKKVRRIGSDNSVIAGFAGSTADAFALFERLESKLDQYKNQLKRACVELAKDWRTDRYLRRLEAMMIVADKDISLLLSGTGDVIETDEGILDNSLSNKDQKISLDDMHNNESDTIVIDKDDIQIEDVETVQEGNLDAAVERKNRYLAYKLPSIN